MKMIRLFNADGYVSGKILQMKKNKQIQNFTCIIADVKFSFWQPKEMLMNYYEVGYWSYEEAPSYTLTHEREYTQEQFDELVAHCMAKVFKAKTEDDYGNSIQYLIDKTIKMLEDEFGFKQPIVKARFSPFGLADIDKEDDWKPQVTDAQLELVRSKIAKN